MFRESEDKIMSGDMDTVFPPSPPLPPVHGADIRNDLIIEMITSLHDSRVSGTTTESGISQTPSPLDGILSQVSTQGSPSRPRRQRLSLTNLETIHEADLDRLLNDVTPADRPRGGTDSDFYSLTDSDTASPSSLHPKKVWGLQEDTTSDEELMKQLHQLSMMHQGLGEVKSPAVTTHQSKSPSSGHLEGQVINTS